MAIVLPHPSPLNKKWLKDHPDFMNKRIIEVRKIIKEIIKDQKGKNHDESITDKEGCWEYLMKYYEWLERK